MSITAHKLRRSLSQQLGPDGPATYVASAGTREGGGDVIVTKPTGTTEGDLMVAFIMVGSSGVTPTYPSGWTQATLDTTGANSGAVAYKIAGASEPSDYTFTLGGSFGRTVQITTIRNVRNLTVGTYDEGSDDTLVAPSITATEGILLAWFGAEGTPSRDSAPSGMTLGVQTTGGPICWTYYQTVSSGSTGNKTLTISDPQDNRSILVGVYW